LIFKVFFILFNFIPNISCNFFLDYIGYCVLNVEFWIYL
jgi:hypothetical protein